MDTRLQENREAIERFIQALREAEALIEQMTTQELAELTASYSDVFGGVPVEDLELAYQLIQPIVPTGEDAGRISETDWQAAIETLSFWEQPGASPDDPRLQYDQMIDNSYFDATQPVPVCESGQEATPENPCRVG
jgi:hypothetical protein